MFVLRINEVFFDPDFGQKDRVAMKKSSFTHGIHQAGRVIKIPLGILIMWIVLNKIPLLLIYCFKQEIHWIGSQKRLIRSRFLSIPLNKIRVLIPLFPLNEISKDNWITWINRQIWNVNQILNKTPQFHFHICLNKIPLSCE